MDSLIWAGVKRVPVAFGFDEGKEIHPLKLANTRLKAMRKLPHGPNGTAGRETSSASQPTNFFARMLALWPPKPKELLRTASTFISRAVLGT